MTKLIRFILGTVFAALSCVLFGITNPLAGKAHPKNPVLSMSKARAFYLRASQ